MLGPLELDLESAVSCLTRMLRAELEEGPLQEQSWLLTTEPFHQPQEIVLESVFVRL